MNSALNLKLSKAVLRKELVQSLKQRTKAAGGSAVGSTSGSIQNGDIYTAVAVKRCSQRKGAFRQALRICEQLSG